MKVSELIKLLDETADQYVNSDLSLVSKAELISIRDKLNSYVISLRNYFSTSQTYMERQRLFKMLLQRGYQAEDIMDSAGIYRIVKDCYNKRSAGVYDADVEDKLRSLNINADERTVKYYAQFMQAAVSEVHRRNWQMATDKAVSIIDNINSELSLRAGTDAFTLEYDENEGTIPTPIIRVECIRCF